MSSNLLEPQSPGKTTTATIEKTLLKLTDLGAGVSNLLRRHYLKLASPPAMASPDKLGIYKACDYQAHRRLFGQDGDITESTNDDPQQVTGTNFTSHDLTKLDIFKDDLEYDAALTDDSDQANQRSSTVQAEHTVGVQCSQQIASTTVKSFVKMERHQEDATQDDSVLTIRPCDDQESSGCVNADCDPHVALSSTTNQSGPFTQRQTQSLPQRNTHRHEAVHTLTIPSTVLSSTVDEAGVARREGGALEGYDNAANFLGKCKPITLRRDAK